MNFIFNGFCKFKSNGVELRVQDRRAESFRFGRGRKIFFQNTRIEIVGKLWIKNCRNCVEVSRQSANRVPCQPAERHPPARRFFVDLFVSVSFLLLEIKIWSENYLSLAAANKSQAFRVVTGATINKAGFHEFEGWISWICWRVSPSLYFSLKP